MFVRLDIANYQSDLSKLTDQNFKNCTIFPVAPAIMGCLSSTPTDNTGSKANEVIDKATEKYKAVEQIKYKLLLLGAGESGKSTLLKQMRMLHGRKFDQSELLAAKPHLTQVLICDTLDMFVDCENAY